jgi:hypothetical protein
MKLNCDDACRIWIPKALAGDLGQVELEQLDTHLLECPSCSKEQELYANTLQQLRTAADLPVPRHFFVYQEGRHSWRAMMSRLVRPVWRFALGAVAALVVAFSALVASHFQFKQEAGVYSFSFGRPLTVKETSTRSPADVEVLKRELLRLLARRSEHDRQLWMDALHQEVRQTSQKLTRQQQRQWDSALARLEARLNNRIESQSLTLKAGVDRSMGNLYQALQLQRQQDLATTRTRLERIAAEGELKNRETEEILTTLLQVAEFQTK